MAFKSKGGFVIRPIVTADSQGGANASIATINSSLATVNSRLTELESKVFPATVVSMDLVKLTDMTFDLTVVFSKTIRQLTSADLELTSCTAANFRRPSDTTQVITLTATSPTQFSYKIKEDSVAGRFVGSSLQTKVANQKRIIPYYRQDVDNDYGLYTSFSPLDSHVATRNSVVLEYVRVAEADALIYFSVGPFGDASIPTFLDLKMLGFSYSGKQSILHRIVTPANAVRFGSSPYFYWSVSIPASHLPVSFYYGEISPSPSGLVALPEFLYDYFDLADGYVIQATTLVY